MATVAGMSTTIGGIEVHGTVAEGFGKVADACAGNFTDPCDGTTVGPDGDDLPHYPVVIDDEGDLILSVINRLDPPEERIEAIRLLLVRHGYLAADDRLQPLLG